MLGKNIPGSGKSRTKALGLGCARMSKQRKKTVRWGGVANDGRHGGGQTMQLCIAGKNFHFDSK